MLQEEMVKTTKIDIKKIQKMHITQGMNMISKHISESVKKV